MVLQLLLNLVGSRYNRARVAAEEQLEFIRHHRSTRTAVGRPVRQRPVAG